MAQVQVERKPQFPDMKPAPAVKMKAVGVRKMQPTLRGWQAWLVTIDMEGKVTETALGPLETSLDAERRAGNELHIHALPPRQSLPNWVRHG